MQQTEFDDGKKNPSELGVNERPPCGGGQKKTQFTRRGGKGLGPGPKAGNGMTPKSHMGICRKKHVGRKPGKGELRESRNEQNKEVRSAGQGEANHRLGQASKKRSHRSEQLTEEMVKNGEVGLCTKISPSRAGEKPKYPRPYQWEQSGGSNNRGGELQRGVKEPRQGGTTCGARHYD